MNERIIKLKEQVKELMEWKKQNSIQQIPFNPPVITQTIIDINHFVVQTEYIIAGGTGVALEVNLDNKIFYMPVIPN
jgi:hypothetical protein